MSLLEKELYEFGPFSLDPAERVISRDGTSLPLTPKVFDTLLCLVRNRGRLLTKDELLKEIWPETFVEEVNLAVNISTLRKAFGESPQDGRYIATVPGKGYRFVAEVREMSRADADERGAIASSQPVAGLPVSPGLTGRESILGGPQESNDGVGIVVTPGSASRSRAWKLALSAATLLLLAAIVGGYFRFGQRKKNVLAAGAPSIAVLSFSDLSASKDQQYFSDGLAEELINDLAKIPGVRVVARSSAFQFKGKNEDVRSVGQKLGVANVLDGSIRREGDRVRIMAELIKADDGFQLWSATYDRKIDDVFKIQDEIARATTAALRVKLVGSGSGTFVPSERAANPEAYQAYLQAQAFFRSGEDKGNIDRALASADEAIKLDPNYAPAWALRSRILDVMAAYSMTNMADGYARAREDAMRAISLNPGLASGYLALGWIQIMYDWDWEGAENSSRKAAELEPGSVEVLRYRSSLARTEGRLDEAIELYQKVLALDPLSARSYSSLAGQLYSAGRFDEANAMLQRALELNPQKEHDQFMRGQILLAQGRPREALAEIDLEQSEVSKLLGQALAYHALGQPHDSDAALQRLIATHQQDCAYQIAQAYAYRSETDKAWEWLDRSYRQRDGGLMSVKIDPLLKGLRQDPRYIHLLKRMHLPT